MPRIQLSLSISREEYLKWYSNSAKDVITKAKDGRMVQFPAGVLQPFVTHFGVEGAFEIEFTDSGKFRSIQRV